MGRRRTARRSAVAGVAVVMMSALTGCSGSEAGPEAAERETTARPPGGDTSSAPAGNKASAAPSDACAKRLVDPDAPIVGAVFADCLVNATNLAVTARMTTTYPDSSATGPIRMSTPFELHLVMSDGGELFIRDKRGWLKGQGGWIEAKQGGSPQEVIADTVVKSYLGLTDPRVQKQFFATSQWKPVTSDPETVNGSRTIAYSGSPALGDATFDDYRIWIDENFLPVRIVSTVTLFGRTSTGQQDYKDWGEPVRFPAGLPR